MNEPEIQFHFELEEFRLKDQDQLINWLKSIARQEEKGLGKVNYVFCDDEYLLELNKQFLDHDYYTDILSFQSKKDPMEGDIFISVERVIENADTFKVQFEKELYRVISHGLLHFVGYNDHDEEETRLMRSKEDHYLAQITF